MFDKYVSFLDEHSLLEELLKTADVSDEIPLEHRQIICVIGSLLALHSSEYNECISDLRLETCLLIVVIIMNFGDCFIMSPNLSLIFS